MLSRLTGGRFGEGKHRRAVKKQVDQSMAATKELVDKTVVAGQDLVDKSMVAGQDLMDKTALGQATRRVLHMAPAPRSVDQSFELLRAAQLVVAHDIISVGGSDVPFVPAHDVLRVVEEPPVVEEDGALRCLMTLAIVDREPLSILAPNAATRDVWMAHVALVSGGGIARDVRPATFERWPSSVTSSLPSSAIVLRRMSTIERFGMVDDDMRRAGLAASIVAAGDDETKQLLVLRKFVLGHDDPTGITTALERCGFRDADRFDRMSDIAEADVSQHCIGHYIVGVVHFLAEELFDEADVRSGGAYIEADSQAWRRKVARTLLSSQSEGALGNLMNRAVIAHTEPLLRSPRASDRDAAKQRAGYIPIAESLLTHDLDALPDAEVIATIDAELDKLVLSAARLSTPQAALDALHTFMERAAGAEGLGNGARAARHVAIAFLRRVARGASALPVEPAIESVVHVLRWYIVNVLQQCDATAHADRAVVATLECAAAVARSSVRCVERTETSEDEIGLQLVASEVQHLTSNMVVARDIARRTKRGGHGAAVFGQKLDTLVFQKLCGDDPLHVLVVCCRYVASFAQSLLRADPKAALVEGWQKRAGPGMLAVCMEVDPAHVERMVRSFDRGDAMCLAALPSTSPDGQPAFLEYRVRVVLKIIASYIAKFPGALIPRSACMVLMKAYLLKKGAAGHEGDDIWGKIVGAMHDGADEKKVRVAIMALIFSLLHRLIATLEDEPAGRDGTIESPPLSVEMQSLIGAIIVDCFEKPAMRVHTLEKALITMIRKGVFPLEAGDDEDEELIQLDVTLDPESNLDNSQTGASVPMASPEKLKRRGGAAPIHIPHRAMLRSATSELRITVNSLDKTHEHTQTHLEEAHKKARRRRKMKQRKAKLISDAIEREVNLADVNHDGTIEPAELNQLLAHMFPALTEEERTVKTTELMAEYDDDESGALDTREVRHCLKNLAKKIPSFASEAAGAHYSDSDDDEVKKLSTKEPALGSSKTKSAVSEYWFGETTEAGHAEHDAEMEELIDTNGMATPQSRKALNLKRHAKMAQIDLQKRLRQEHDAKTASMHKRMAGKRRLANKFRKYDTSGDGSIDINELRYMIECELGPSDTVMEPLLQEIMTKYVIFIFLINTRITLYLFCE